MASFPETAHFPAHDNRTKGISVEEHAEDSGLSARVEKLNVNLLTVGTLLVLAVGGAVSFGILYEQNRRHEATLAKMVDVVDDLRLLAATHSHAIETLKDKIAELERNKT